MSYEEFVDKVKNIADKTKTKVKFKEEDGRYTAYAGTVQMTGNSDSKDITVRWGEYQKMSPHPYRQKHQAVLKG